MGREEFQRVRAAFEAALELPADERAASIEASLGGEPELVREALEMLRADTEGGDFLRAPGDQTLAGDLERHEAAVSLAIGDRIGEGSSTFVLEARLGQGGMGEVWRARQERPQRQVALKVLRASLISERSRRRFEDEAEVLAKLSHPGIARVLASGVTGVTGVTGGDAARPWFAMELVEEARGLVAAARELDLAGRLKLFHQACEAIHHGHLRGVIHRDIKPDNLLVDGSGRLRVIDFGIARASGSEATSETLAGELVGTLAYMSPEQIEGKSDEIDARTDVYALGVVLFELLCGRSPWKTDSTSWAALTREVTSADAPAPSSLAPEVSMELDWVVAKAMEKSPERRYASAHDLAEEIRRFEANEPLLAGPPTAGYLLKKFARRHRAWVVGGTTALALLVLGVIGTSYGLKRSLDRGKQLEIAKGVAEEATLEAEARGRALEVSKDKAEAATRQAEERLLRADALNRFLDRTLRSANPLKEKLGLSGETTVAEMLRRAKSEIDTAFEGQPDLEAEVRLLIGVSLHGQGHYTEAAEELGRAFELYADMQPENVTESLRAQRLLAMSEAHLEDWDNAVANMQAALERGKAELPEDHLERGALESDYAWLLQQLGHFDEALPHARAALATFDARGPEFAARAVTSATIIAASLRRLDDDAATEAAYRDAIRRVDETFGPASVYAGVTASNLGTFLYSRGRTTEALTEFERAAKLERAGLSSGHPMLATTLYNLGAAQQEAGKLDAAEASFQECFELLDATKGAGHNDTEEAVLALASVYKDQERFAEARAGYERFAAYLDANGESATAMRTMIALRVLEMRARNTSPETVSDAEAARAEFLELDAALREQHGKDSSLATFAARTGARIFPEDAAKWTALAGD